MKEKEVCIRVLCTPPSIPGGSQQSGGRHRGGRFWPKGRSFVKVALSVLKQLKDDPAFVVDEISEAELESHAEKPVESTEDKLERLETENAELRIRIEALEKKRSPSPKTETPTAPKAEIPAPNEAK